MKKIIITSILLMSFCACACAMQACKCPCGNRESTALDHLKVFGAFTGFLSSPAYMNYMLYKDNNMTGLYIYDGFLLGSAAVALFSGDLLDSKVRDTSTMALALISTVVVWGYSDISLINGIFQKDGEKTGRGAVGAFVVPVVFITAFILTLDCRCRPENECLVLNPVIGPEYAGLNCNLKF